MTNFKAVVVGRHSGDIPGVEVIERRAVVFPMSVAKCVAMMKGIIANADGENAVVLLQAVPGQLAAALIELDRQGFLRPEKVGVIIAVPGERPAQKRISVDFYDPRLCDGDEFPNGWEWHLVPERAATATAELVASLNPNATVTVDGTTVTVVSDPPMMFVFSHIQWLGGSEDEQGS